MKTIVITLATLAVTLIGTATRAEARRPSNHIYISGYQSCGTPIRTERYFVGYDPCGRPIWGYRTVRSHYRPVVRERYHAPCPPPVRYERHHDRSVYHRGHSGGRLVIQGSIYR